MVVDPLAVRSLAPLAALLANKGVVKGIHNAAFERGVFARAGHALVNVFDTLQASRAARGRDALGGHSLAAVCERELGVTIDKAMQTSNWARGSLSAEQLAYAQVDVEVLVPLYLRWRDTLAPLLAGV